MSERAALEFDDLMRDRKSGLGMKEMATRYGVSENQVRHFVRSHERYEEWRRYWAEGGCRMGRKRRPIHRLPIDEMIRKLMETHNEVSIERGMSEGFIAYIDDTPGVETKNLRQALQTAIKAIHGEK